MIRTNKENIFLFAFEWVYKEAKKAVSFPLFLYTGAVFKTIIHRHVLVLSSYNHLQPRLDVQHERQNVNDQKTVCSQISVRRYNVYSVLKFI